MSDASLGRPLEGLILWEPYLVLEYIKRSDVYLGCLRRTQEGPQGMSAQTYSDVMTGLRQRLIDPAKLALAQSDLDGFTVVPLDKAAADECSRVRRERQRLLDGTPDDFKMWTYWQCALVRVYPSYRILARSKAVYAGLVDPSRLV